jgi:hypothetical protein
MRSLKLLAKSLMTIQLNEKLQLSTVNITYSRETSRQKEIVVSFIIGASIRYYMKMRKQAIKLKTENMLILIWVSDVKNVLTEK